MSTGSGMTGVGSAGVSATGSAGVSATGSAGVSATGSAGALGDRLCGGLGDRLCRRFSDRLGGRGLGHRWREIHHRRRRVHLDRRYQVAGVNGNIGYVDGELRGGGAGEEYCEEADGQREQENPEGPRWHWEWLA